MAREPEKGPVSLSDGLLPGLREVVPPAEQARAGAVLEAAVTLADRRDQEQKARERRGAAEETEVALTDPAKVPGETLGIRAVHARDRDLVGDPAGLEFHECEPAHLDRVVDQLVVVGRRVGPEPPGRGPCARHRRRHTAVRRPFGSGPDQVHAARTVLAPHGVDQEARAVEVGPVGVQVGAADRQVVRVDLVDEGQRPRHRGAAPALLVDLPDGNGPAPGLGAAADHVAREFPDEIATRDPGG